MAVISRPFVKLGQLFMTDFLQQHIVYGYILLKLCRFAIWKMKKHAAADTALAQQVLLFKYFDEVFWQPVVAVKRDKVGHTFKTLFFYDVMCASQHCGIEFWKIYPQRFIS